MRPIPETQVLFDHLRASGDESLPAALLVVARRLVEIVPDCVGLSLSVVDEGITLTLVASGSEAAGLDVCQYLDDGPCVTAVEVGERIEVRIDDLLDEGRWLAYARLGAAVGVASSLSLPVTVDGEIVGGVNLYASTPDAFDGRHETIAAALGSPAEWAVSNADLTFSSRMRAVESAQRVEAHQEVAAAVEVISQRHGIGTAEAHERLRRAAAQAGVSEADAARAVNSPRG